MKNVNWYINFLLLLFIGTAGAQEMRILKGRVTDSIPVRDSLSGTYALYIPQSVEAGKPNPVIFVFDPEGRGVHAAQLFRRVAEEQSYIVAASNVRYSQDSLKNNLNEAFKMVGSVLQLVPVDTDMIYTAGLDEGAQVASAMPMVYKEVDGVLAVGDALFNPEYLAEENKFMFSALVSMEDFQKDQLEDIVGFFEKKDFPVEIGYYSEAAGEWPEARVISNAVSGFTLQAIQQGKRPADPEFINGLFQDELAYAERLRRTREYYASYQKLEQLEEKYQNYEKFEDTLKQRRKELRRTRAFRKQRREIRNLKDEEQIHKEDYIYFLENDLATANFDNIGWWAYQVDELHRIQKEGSLAEAQMAHRLEDFLKYFIEQRYEGVSVKNLRNIDAKIFTSVLRTVLDKENPEAYLNIIKLAGHDGDHETALLYLEDLLKTGFDDMEALYNIPGILDLKLSPEYNELIGKNLGNSKYYQAELEEVN
ncbi:hypothetical protein RM553_16545 [Zunongwangia sp. F363]|uniref:Alpha/beta hydrolase n=1 Tax=Autumnicola tepida TaxID=3075595 RepID=A0ABU3CDP7_9FLAO|nr:hypothetical protein [Zunongwangia sp. F363]MDT0644450.1 hypothetical protein [Zunongwangia sp. F363]